MFLKVYLGMWYITIVSKFVYSVIINCIRFNCDRYLTLERYT